MSIEPPEPQPAGLRGERLLQVLLLAVLAGYSLLFLYHAARLILYPYTIDYGEGFILNHANELANFRNPYRPISEPPWLVVHYPPVYPMLVGVGVKAFGPQFHFGRLLSLFGILLAGYCLLRLIREQTGDRFAAWVGALAWITAYPVYNWGTHHRVDSVGIGLEALGLLFLFGGNHLKASAGLFLAALYTRQTLWVGPLAGYLYLRRTRGPRAAASWFGGVLLAGGIIFFALILLTRGEFYQHIVYYNANRFHWKDVWVMLHNAVMQMMKLQVAFLLYYLLRAAFTRQWDLAAFCIPFSIATFCLVGKIGSATNYLFELTLVASWTVGLVIAELRVYLPRGNPLRMLIPAILFLGILFPVHLPHFYGEWKIFDWGGTPDSDSEDLTAMLVERLKDIPEPIFSQDAGAALLSGHSLVWDPFMMTQLAEQGRFDPAPFIRMIQEKKFNAIVLPFDLDMNPDAWKDDGWWSQFTEEVAAAVARGYRVVPAAPFSPATPDVRFRGYYSPFGNNYLYLRK